MGAGYSMFYTFKKSMAWCLLVLTIFVSVPCILIFFIRLVQTHSLSAGTESYLAKFTAGSVYLSERYSTLDAYIKDNAQIIIDVVVYFNMAGIVYLLVHSIILRRALVAMNVHIDNNEVSPSDFALLVRNIPLTTTKQDLIK